MPRSRATTTRWSRCWATWPPTTCRCAPSRGASQCAQANVRVAARDAADHRGAIPRRHDQRVGRIPGPQHPGADPGRDSRVARSASGRPRTSCAFCWASRRKSCRASSARRRFPTAPVEVAVGIPADLLRRRPDVRRAERLAAAQCAQIGVAEADFYPRHLHQRNARHTRPRHFPDLFRASALNGSRRSFVPVEHPQLRADPATTSGSRTPGSRSWWRPISRPCSAPTRKSRTVWSRSSAPSSGRSTRLPA